MAIGNPPTTQRPIDGWVDERLHWRELSTALLHVRVPLQAKTFFFGGILLFLFGVQVLTGTLLALYYKPTPDRAYDSVLFITSDVRFGWLIRSVHHWGANLMILFLVLHLLRVFFLAAYKYPRELTWVVGVGLLGVTMMFGFTGYLLPWDQGSGTIVCPCHDGRFNVFTGAVLSGPPPRGLPAVEVSVEGEEIYVVSG